MRLQRLKALDFVTAGRHQLGPQELHKRRHGRRGTARAEGRCRGQTPRHTVLAPPAKAMQHAGLQAGARSAVAPAQRTTEEALALLSPGPSSAVGAAASGEDDFSSAQSLWFKKEAFTAPEFDPDEYVRDLQRFVRATHLLPCTATLPVLCARRPRLTRRNATPLSLVPCAHRCLWKPCGPRWTPTWQPSRTRCAPCLHVLCACLGTRR